MDFETLTHERFSVRDFQTAPVEQAKIDKILESGRIAPTARNSQSQRIKLVGGKELAKVDECTPCRFNAPLVLLVCYDRTVCPPGPHGTGTGETDAAIAVTHMMLQAWELGIGSCWVQHFDAAKTREIFGLAPNLVPISYLPLGYPASGCKTSPNHGRRLPIKDFLI